MSETLRTLVPQDPPKWDSQVARALARHQFDSLERWLCSEEVGVMGLRGVEVGEELRGRELLRLLLQAHVECRGDGDVGAAIEVLGCGNPHGVELYTHKRMHLRSIVTIFGEVCVRRLGYGMPGEPSIHPLDERLQLPARRYSYEIQRRLVKRAVQGPFDEAVDALYEATGLRVPKRSAEEIVIEASVDFESFYARRQGHGGCESGPVLVGSVDCKGIPMVKSEPALKTVRRRKGEKAQKKRMATVGAVFTQRPRVRTPEEVVESLFDPHKGDGKSRNKAPGPERKRVWASLEAGKDSFIRDVHEEMNRRDPRGDKLRVVVTDGERALQRRVGCTMKGVLLVLDFLHVLERLWAAGHALYGEGSDEAEKFVRQRALRILRGQVSGVVKGLRQIVTKRKLIGQKRKKLLAAAGYYYRNKGRMRYDEYLDRGLPIASGSVEGACKNLIKDRMERSGMRWTPRMAEAMVKMRATYLSGDFELYWDCHVTQEQQRLYPKDHWRPLITVVPK
jgi:hypothetical protein